VVDAPSYHLPPRHMSCLFRPDSQARKGDYITKRCFVLKFRSIVFCFAQLHGFQMDTLRWSRVVASRSNTQQVQGSVLTFITGSDPLHFRGPKRVALQPFNLLREFNFTSRGRVGGFKQDFKLV